MGCASSKHLETVLKAEGFERLSLSQSPHKKKKKNNIHNHHVALTSSTYGLFNPEALESSTQQESASQRGNSFDSPTNPVYEKLKKFDVNTESGPQSWLEVSKVLDNLKPALEEEKKNNKENPLKCRDGESETVDASWDIVERDGEITQPGGVSVERKTQFFDGRNIKFHTLEELDAKIGRVDGKVASSPVKYCLQKNPSGKFIQSSSKVLDNLKPSLQEEQKNNKKNPGRNRDGEFETSDASWDVVERDGEFTPPGKVSADRKTPFFDGKNIKFHRLEDLDAKIGRADEKKVGNPMKDSLQKNPSGDLIQSSLPIDRNAEGSASQKKIQGPNLYLNDNANSRDEFSMKPNGNLYDPELLSSTLKSLSEDDWNAVRNKDSDEEKPGHCGVSPMTENAKDKGSSYGALQGKKNPLDSFEEKCPPGGEKAVVLYTTTLRGIRKTYEDCNNVRSVLESFGVSIDERDVSMHLDFRNELKELMGKPVPVPRLFIRGRYIGGADEVLQLHEDGKLDGLLAGLSTDGAGKVCDGCGGMRFVPCLECSGSCKLVNDQNVVVRCPHCNENGLIQCPICSADATY